MPSPRAGPAASVEFAPVAVVVVVEVVIGAWGARLGSTEEAEVAGSRTELEALGLWVVGLVSAAESGFVGLWMAAMDREGHERVSKSAKAGVANSEEG